MKRKLGEILGNRIQMGDWKFFRLKGNDDQILITGNRIFIKLCWNLHVFLNIIFSNIGIFLRLQRGMNYKFCLQK